MGDSFRYSAGGIAPRSAPKSAGTAIAPNGRQPQNRKRPKEAAVESSSPQDVVGPIDAVEPVAAADAAPSDPAPVRAVQVLSSAVRIEELSIERQVIVNYLETVAPEREAIAVHSELRV